MELPKYLKLERLYQSFLIYFADWIGYHENKRSHPPWKGEIKCVKSFDRGRYAACYDVSFLFNEL